MTSVGLPIPHCCLSFPTGPLSLSLHLRGCPSSTLPCPWVGLVGYSFVLQLARTILLPVTLSPGLPFLGSTFRRVCPSPGRPLPGLLFSGSALCRTVLHRATLPQAPCLPFPGLHSLRPALRRAFHSTGWVFSSPVRLLSRRPSPWCALLWVVPSAGGPSLSTRSRPSSFRSPSLSGRPFPASPFIGYTLRWAIRAHPLVDTDSNPRRSL